jgi:LysM repeat protein
VAVEPAPVEEALPPMIAVPTATPGIPNKVKLQKNEYIYCLARRYDIDPVALMNFNGLGPYTLLNTGQVIKLPQDAPQFPGSRQLLDHPTVVTVAADDTIYTLACAFGDVDPLAIAIANGLTEPYKLKPGQQLHIP